MAAARTPGGNDASWVVDRPGAEPKRSPLASAAGGAVLLFGAGMALSGYCPGTAAAAAGSGRREAVWAMAGMLAAATVFVATYPRLKKALEAGSLGRVTVAGGTPARAATPPLDVVVRPGAVDARVDPVS
jgi:uncharacterized membrane protein YedE/YeeE